MLLGGLDPLWEIIFDAFPDKLLLFRALCHLNTESIESAPLAAGHPIPEIDTTTTAHTNIAMLCKFARTA
jgi:hypothetical protein